MVRNLHVLACCCVTTRRTSRKVIGLHLPFTCPGCVARGGGHPGLHQVSVHQVSDSVIPKRPKSEFVHVIGCSPQNSAAQLLHDYHIIIVGAYDMIMLKPGIFIC